MKILILSVVVFGSCFFFANYRVGVIERSCPAIGRFLKVNNQKIHYVENGSGPKILLIHGAASNLRDYTSSIFTELSKDNQVIALDRPGLGYSEISEAHKSRTIDAQIDLIYQFAKEKKFEGAVLVGHSLGGAVVAGLASRFPDFFGGLVILAGAVYPVGDGRSWYTVASELPVFGWLFNNIAIPIFAPIGIGKKVAYNFEPAKMPEGYVENSCLNLLFRPETFLNNSRDLNQIRLQTDKMYSNYNRIKIPVTLIYGVGDNIVHSKIHAPEFKKVVPQSQLFMLENVGHLPHYSRQGLVIEQIRKMAKSSGVQ